jgi:hypothetical protein
VAVEYGPLHPWEPTDFQLDGLVDVAVRSSGCNPRKSVQKETRSENDWAFVCAQLADGKEAGKLTQELAARRSDKPNPLYYAQRTVDVASARQWFLEGAPIDDVVTMLHERRRFDLPAALCSSRSREIAATAQRMIVRQKIA